MIKLDMGLDAIDGQRFDPIHHQAVREAWRYGSRGGGPLPE
ncbi:MAG: hypothetical protein PF961_09630 [Planctomycetota bacterium]|nr:hypothetical protein [Planctomycetota bacterium]